MHCVCWQLSLRIYGFFYFFLKKTPISWRYWRAGVYICRLRRWTLTYCKWAWTVTRCNMGFTFHLKKRMHFVWLRLWACTVRRVPEVKFLLVAGQTWYSQLLVKVHIHLTLTVYLWLLPSHPQLFLPVVFTDFLPSLALQWVGSRVPHAHPAGSPRAVLWEPVWYGHDKAEETQTDTVHLGRDGDVGKEGVVPAHENTATFKVLDDVEDLLALRLSHHPAYVQQGGDMLLPVGRRDAKRKRSTKV